MLAGLSSQSKKAKRPVCLFTHSVLPDTNVDIKNPPMKRLPFSILHSPQAFSSVDAALPAEIYDQIESRVLELSRVEYARVRMSLLDILSGEFFNQYIKIGNIVMQSQSRNAGDLVVQLINGVLSIELDAPTYERCGLVGKPIASGGRKHVKSRYLIDYNLRLPSMLHGKKGFERLVYACKNVLNKQIVWLFTDLSQKSTEEQARAGPIKEFQPTWHTTFAQVTDCKRQWSPFANNHHTSRESEDRRSDELDYIEELFEWIGMMGIKSPRLGVDDSINHYLCSYESPANYIAPSEDQESEPSDFASEDIVYLRWQGLLNSSFASVLFVCLREVIRTRPTPPMHRGTPWFTMTARTFAGRSTTVCCPGTKTENGALDVLTWDIPS